MGNICSVGRHIFGLAQYQMVKKRFKTKDQILNQAHFYRNIHSIFGVYKEKICPIDFSFFYRKQLLEPGAAFCRNPYQNIL